MERNYPAAPSHVYLFGTCVIDMFMPQAGLDAVRLLEREGLKVHFPRGQSCCGQPAYSSGNPDEARAVALAQLDLFPNPWPVIVPSGSCAGMLKKHYPTFFKGDPKWENRATDFAAKAHELISFLVDIRGVQSVAARFDGAVTYHDSCSGLRELGIRAQPRALLGTVRGLKLNELTEADVCCGFGGTFAVKYGEISDKIVSEKTNRIGGTGASTLLAGDLGCLMNMAGKLRRQGSPVAVRHVAEVLAGMTDLPPIGAPEERP